MLKRKVGDKVTIREDLKEDSYYNSTLFTYDMMNYMGKEATIKAFSVGTYLKDRYFLDIDGGVNYWTDDMFEDKCIPSNNNNEQTIQKYKELITFLLYELEENSKVDINKSSTLYYLRKLRPDLYSLVQIQLYEQFL